MRRVFVLCLVIFATVVSSVLGFDGNRKGFVLGGGLGFGPVAKIAADGYEGEAENSGIASNFLIGYAWDEKNMIVYYRDAIFYEKEFLGDDITLVQGFSGAGYLHYFGNQGKSAFIVAGLGMQDWQALDEDYDDADPGAGLLIGGGYEFARHWQFGMNLSFGNTEQLGFDLKHTQLTFCISTVAF